MKRNVKCIGFLFAILIGSNLRAQDTEISSTPIPNTNQNALTTGNTTTEVSQEALTSVDNQSKPLLTGDGYSGIPWGTTVDDFKLNSQTNGYQVNQGLDKDGVFDDLINYLGTSIKPGKNYSDGFAEYPAERWSTAKQEYGDINYFFDNGKLFMVSVDPELEYQNDVLKKLNSSYSLAFSKLGVYGHRHYNLKVFKKGEKLAFFIKSTDVIAGVKFNFFGIIYTSKGIIENLKNEMKENHFENIRQDQKQQNDEKNENLKAIE